MEEKFEIGRLLAVLGSAIAAAVLFAVFMIYYYGPSGEYYVKNILLSPETAARIDFQDGREEGRFVFDRAEFRYFNTEVKSWKTIILDTKAYQAVYDLLENESSVSDVTPDIVDEFNRPNSATLTLYVKNNKLTKIFQEAVFPLGGDFYRILLRGKDPIGEWGYFHHRKIYDHVLHAIIPAGAE